MTKIKDLPKHLRPREKMLESGPENLSNAELLAVLIRTGRSGFSAIDIAKSILRKWSLSDLSRIRHEDLSKIKGMDVGKSTSLLATIEISRRLYEMYTTHLPTLRSVDDLLSEVSDIRNKKKEHLLALYVNARNQLILKDVVSIGTVNSSLVHPREVFAPALEVRASGVFLVHNHPSGDSEPSINDIEITEQMSEAAGILGIELMDHVIVTINGFSSLKALGYIK